MTTVKRPTQAERRLELRDRLWSDASHLVWNRKVEHGFCTIPRILPLVMTLINRLSEKKEDPSQVYMELWSRAFDEGFIQIGNEEEHAFASGYVTPQRGVRSWRERMRKLERMGFIRIKPNGMQMIGFVLLIHPHLAIDAMKKQSRVEEGLYNAFLKRLSDTGAVHKGGSPHKKTGKK
jgi:hypothetical protein